MRGLQSPCKEIFALKEEIKVPQPGSLLVATDMTNLCQVACMLLLACGTEDSGVGGQLAAWPPPLHTPSLLGSNLCNVVLLAPCAGHPPNLQPWGEGTPAPVTPRRCRLPRGLAASSVGTGCSGRCFRCSWLYLLP